jgi:superfamily II DNA or RNA helicase
MKNFFFLLTILFVSVQVLAGSADSLKTGAETFNFLSAGSLDQIQDNADSTNLFIVDDLIEAAIITAVFLEEAVAAETAVLVVGESGSVLGTISLSSIATEAPIVYYTSTGVAASYGTVAATTVGATFGTELAIAGISGTVMIGGVSYSAYRLWNGKKIYVKTTSLIENYFVKEAALAEIEKKYKGKAKILSANRKEICFSVKGLSFKLNLKMFTTSLMKVQKLSDSEVEKAKKWAKELTDKEVWKAGSKNLKQGKYFSQSGKTYAKVKGGFIVYDGVGIQKTGIFYATETDYKPQIVEGFEYLKIQPQDAGSALQRIRDGKAEFNDRQILERFCKEAESGSLKDRVCSFLESLARSNREKVLIDIKSGDFSPLRWYQHECMTSIIAALEEGHDRFYVQAPTGFGKTFVFGTLVKAYQGKSLIIVPDKLLLRQTAKSVSDFVGEDGREVGRVFSEAKQFGRDITIVTYASLQKQIESGNIIPDQYGLVIYDEAHSLLASGKSHIPNLFKNSIQIGFTATPEYHIEKKLVDILPFECYKMTPKEAIQQGILADPEIYVAVVKVDFGDIPLVKNSFGDKDFNQAKVDKVINTEAMNRGVVKLLHSYSNRKGLINCVSIDQAKKIFAIMNKEGYRVGYVTGKECEISSGDLKKSEEISNAFRTGVINFLIGVDMLNTGIDFPNADLLINLRPTASKVLATQRLGRVLRLDPKNTNKKPLIIDFIPKSGNIVTAVDVLEKYQDLTGTKSSSGSSNKKETEKTEKPIFKIPEFDVFVDVQEVLSGVRSNMEDLSSEGWVSIYSIAFKLCGNGSVNKDKFLTLAKKLKMKVKRKLFIASKTEAVSIEDGKILEAEWIKRNGSKEYFNSDGWISVNEITVKLYNGHKKRVIELIDKLKIKTEKKMFGKIKTNGILISDLEKLEVTIIAEKNMISLHAISLKIARTKKTELLLLVEVLEIKKVTRMMQNRPVYFLSPEDAQLLEAEWIKRNGPKKPKK